LAVSRAPQITQAAVDARLAHPELAPGGMLALTARNGRQNATTMLKFCVSPMMSNPDDVRRCVSDLEKAYERY